MKNIVLIPVWRRADFLAVTLDHIQKANGADKNCYVFLVDRGYSPSIVSDVINPFPFCKEIRYTPNHRYHGNSYNVLEGYRFAVEAAHECESELVYLLEEDIWIGKDFFDFHEKVQSKYDSFCVSACRNQNVSTELEKDASTVYYHPSFQSLGISWKIDNLKKVTQHANVNYYRNPAGYLRSNFPNSSKTNHSEQDGMIYRIQEQEKGQTLYCKVPRCYHSGFVGYNRRGIPLTGSLEERVAKLKSMTDEEMCSHAIEYKDITSIDLTIDHKVAEFNIK